MCSYFWLSPDCVFLCRLQHLVAQAVLPSTSKHKDDQHTCLQCGAIFSRPHSLHLHEAAHRGCYPYTVCDICGKGCLSKGNRIRHMAYMTLNARYVHSNIHMPLVSENMYNIVIKMLMVMSQICHCSDVPGTCY